MTARTNPERPTDPDDDPLDPVREHADAIEEHLAPRDDRLGAAARYLLALARDDEPDPADRTVIETYGAGDAHERGLTLGPTRAQVAAAVRDVVRALGGEGDA